MRPLLVTFIVGLVVPAGVIADESDEVCIPHDSKFMVHVDIKTFRKTKVGGRLFEIAREAAMEELRSKKDGEDKLEEIKNAIGFDPFTELEAITISGANLKKRFDMNAVFRLKKTAGNLEGLMLGLPDYSSTEYGQHQIHSAVPDNKERIFGAIHTDAASIKRVIVALEIDEVKTMLDTLDASSAKTRTKKIRLSRRKREFLHIEILESPGNIMKSSGADPGKGPHINVANMINRISFKVSDPAGELEMRLELTAAKDKHAEQIHQLIKGGVAMVQLIGDEHDEDLQRAKSYLKKLTVKQKGSSVKLELLVPDADIIELIDQEVALSSLF